MGSLLFVSLEPLLILCGASLALLGAFVPRLGLYGFPYLLRWGACGLRSNSPFWLNGVTSEKPLPRRVSALCAPLWLNIRPESCECTLWCSSVRLPQRRLGLPLSTTRLPCGSLFSSACGAMRSCPVDPLKGHIIGPSRYRTTCVGPGEHIMSYIVWSYIVSLKGPP